MKFEKKTTTIDKHDISLCICYPLDRKKPSIISIHGAGQAGKERISYVTKQLSENKIGSLAFDFPGHGESPGRLSDSSLAHRIFITKQIIYELCDINNLIVIATSMGGHIAAELLPFFNVSALILFCPAAYAQEASEKKFDDSFTKVIRKSKSFLNSKAFLNISEFTGKLLLIHGDMDEIIPKQVLDKYWFSAQKTSYKKRLILKNAPHAIHKWVERSPEAKEEILTEIFSFIKMA